ncbi:sulfurtransferase TusD [Candidatus Photodesmus blepharus]|uniref:Sulfurtransferase TusD homolog n=1 Tax=Candidatus Photodesmus blepharonis TaxID=1179155 RepID=A0A084CNQ4_9GAMM|nr:sulfurtransferase TusD [Candidatus Photodesmus blepharus]
MHLTYTLLVNSPPYGSQSSRSAYLFAKALIRKRYILRDVFFYQDGVLNGSSLTFPANDEFDVVSAWQTLSVKHGVKLRICVAAALRRGVVSAHEARRKRQSEGNLAEHFDQTGLGSLSEAMLTQDRIIQF